ncbi:MAG: hypothetical protein RL662_334 [Bacteroidota bacterium]|jgi:TatD DNase family protein
MDLYDIHTHDVLTLDSDDDVPSSHNTYSSIINVYPLGFEYAKDSHLCEWFSCGVHPWYSEDAEPQLKFLKEIANDKRIIAIGEAGLDKLKGPELEIQQTVFEQQVQLSEQLHKPLIIHCVKAWDELLKTHKIHKPKQAWILHGYRGNAQLTSQLAAYGLYFSVGEKVNDEGLAQIPLNRLFCETDTSDTKIDEIYNEVANLLQTSTEQLAAQIDENIRNVFPLVQAGKRIQSKLG